MAINAKPSRHRRSRRRSSRRAVAATNAGGWHFEIRSGSVGGVEAMAAEVKSTYTITVRPMPGVDSIRALRAALKALRRRYGLLAIDIREHHAPHGLAIEPT